MICDFVSNAIVLFYKIENGTGPTMLVLYIFVILLPLYDENKLLFGVIFPLNIFAFRWTVFLLDTIFIILTNFQFRTSTTVYSDSSITSFRVIVTVSMTLSRSLWLVSDQYLIVIVISVILLLLITMLMFTGSQ